MSDILREGDEVFDGSYAKVQVRVRGSCWRLGCGRGARRPYGAVLARVRRRGATVQLLLRRRRKGVI
ncbi:hypothetical protein V6Z12_A04G170500 [Gossypium hirsutum]